MNNFSVEKTTQKISISIFSFLFVSPRFSRELSTDCNTAKSKTKSRKKTACSLRLIYILMKHKLITLLFLIEHGIEQRNNIFLIFHFCLAKPNGKILLKMYKIVNMNKFLYLYILQEKKYDLLYLVFNLL
jgi:hypothetical protein